MRDTDRTRRAVLTSGVALTTALAGCGSDAPADTPTPDTPTDDGPETVATPDNTASTADTTTGSLDLREANVTEVAVEATGDGRYRFDVTLYHDDDGEDGYANWWQVETPDGTRLGRRELLHAHSTAPFARSATVEIPPDVRCVVVRGHDQTHGYGGQAMLVTVETGATRPLRQGSERQSAEGTACP